MKARRAQGAYITDIAREFNLSRKTISRWVNSESLPPDTRGRFKRKCLIDAYETYLRDRLAEAAPISLNCGEKFASKDLQGIVSW